MNEVWVLEIIEEGTKLVIRNTDKGYIYGYSKLLPDEDGRNLVFSSERDLMYYIDRYLNPELITNYDDYFMNDPKKIRSKFLKPTDEYKLKD
jgi:hypothetical protein